MSQHSKGSGTTNPTIHPALKFQGKSFWASTVQPEAHPTSPGPRGPTNDKTHKGSGVSSKRFRSLLQQDTGLTE